jgi:hypothetical protein
MGLLFCRRWWRQNQRDPQGLEDLNDFPSSQSFLFEGPSDSSYRVRTPWIN